MTNDSTELDPFNPTKIERIFTFEAEAIGMPPYVN
jgi:hypothetical protein